MTVIHDINSNPSVLVRLIQEVGEDPERRYSEGQIEQLQSRFDSLTSGCMNPNASLGNRIIQTLPRQDLDEERLRYFFTQDTRRTSDSPSKRDESLIQKVWNKIRKHLYSLDDLQNFPHVVKTFAPSFA